MKNITDKINKYIHQLKFDYQTNNVYMDITLPSTWSVAPVNNNIEISIHENFNRHIDNYKSYFITTDLNNGHESLIEYLNYIVDYNESITQKLVIFENKISELKELFDVGLTNDELQSITFKYTKKRKYNKNKINKINEDNGGN